MLRFVRALACVVCGFTGGVIACTASAQQQSDFHAIVEPDGKVVLCLTKGELLFADKCAGTGRLTLGPTACREDSPPIHAREHTGHPGH